LGNKLGNKVQSLSCHVTVLVFGDLVGKLDALRVVCSKCERAGRYRLDRLIADRGRDARVTGWLDAARKLSTTILRSQIGSLPKRSALVSRL
jgi:hypothetical protein